MVVEVVELKLEGFEEGDIILGLDTGHRVPLPLPMPMPMRVGAGRLLASLVRKGENGIPRCLVRQLLRAARRAGGLRGRRQWRRRRRRWGSSFCEMLGCGGVDEVGSVVSAGHEDAKVISATHHSGWQGKVEVSFVQAVEDVVLQRLDVGTYADTAAGAGGVAVGSFARHGGGVEQRSAVLQTDLPEPPADEIQLLFCEGGHCMLGEQGATQLIGDAAGDNDGDSCVDGRHPFLQLHPV